MAAAVRTEPGFEAGARKRLFFAPSANDYAVSADGSRFLMRTPVRETGTPAVFTLLTNWSAVAKR